MLDTTLATEFVPGTNLEGDLACADWRFLLPSLQLDHILCLGVPSISTVAVLSTVGQDICVVSSDRRQLRELHEKSHHQGVTNLHTLFINGYTHLPFADNSVALTLLPGQHRTTKVLQNPLVLSELKRLLKPDGMMYFEIKHTIEHVTIRRILSRFAHEDFGTPQAFWLTPLTGEMRTSLPLWNGDIAHYFFTHVMYGQSVRKRILSCAGKVLNRIGLLNHLAPRRAMLVSRSGVDRQFQQPPNYLTALAAEAGIDLAGYRFGLSARGKYNANKVIFYLFGAAGKVPEVVIKMTRSPRFNSRLENEYNMLSLLNEKGFVDPVTIPQPLFFGYHQNSAILGQMAIHAYPFRTRTAGNATCPVAGDAIDWIVQLGKASVETTGATPSEVAATVTKLFERFAEIYALSSVETLFLKEQIATLGRGRAPFPLVFQHGDPGTWNIMVLKTGQAAFIDWEAGERQGMPLWDLFYFLRTYSSWVSRMQGNRNRLVSFQRTLLTPSVLNTLLVEATKRYCVRIGLERELVKPLFYTCWMHRALKEATRLPVASLERGSYVNLLRLCIAQRSSPALQSLFSLSQGR